MGFSMGVELREYSYVSLIWMIMVMMRMRTMMIMIMKMTAPPTYFLPLSATLGRYLDEFFGCPGFPPIGKRDIQGNEDDY